MLRENKRKKISKLEYFKPQELESGQEQFIHEFHRLCVLRYLEKYYTSFYKIFKAEIFNGGGIYIIVCVTHSMCCCVINVQCVVYLCILCHAFLLQTTLSKIAHLFSLLSTKNLIGKMDKLYRAVDP